MGNQRFPHSTVGLPRAAILESRWIPSPAWGTCAATFGWMFLCDPDILLHLLALLTFQLPTHSLCNVPTRNTAKHVMCLLLRGLHPLQSGSRAGNQRKKWWQDERLHPATAFSRCHSGVVAPRRRRAGRAGFPRAAHGKA